MTAGYTETPHNMPEILPVVITEKETIVSAVMEKTQCYFYDTCSFRRHSKLSVSEAAPLLNYIKKQGGMIIITRCILMELASYSGVLNREYIDYIKCIHEAGITVAVLYEEDIFSVMEVCFSTNAAINHYLCWAVRMIKSPVSTITETLDRNKVIYSEVVKGKNLDNSGVYKRFFETVRKNKESGDDLGEELLAICLHILSHLPGEPDGKFCVITDDKGAAGKIDDMFKKTAKQYHGKRIHILSTPKLVQILYHENYICNREQIKAILETGTEGNVIVLGMLAYDLRSRDISLSVEELAEFIEKPGGIMIGF